MVLKGQSNLSSLKDFTSKVQSTEHDLKKVHDKFTEHVRQMGDELKGYHAEFASQFRTKQQYEDEKQELIQKISEVETERDRIVRESNTELRNLKLKMESEKTKHHIAIDKIKDEFKTAAQKAALESERRKAAIREEQDWMETHGEQFFSMAQGQPSGVADSFHATSSPSYIRFQQPSSVVHPHSLSRSLMVPRGTTSTSSHQQSIMSPSSMAPMSSSPHLMAGQTPLTPNIPAQKDIDEKHHLVDVLKQVMIAKRTADMIGNSRMARSSTARMDDSSISTQKLAQSVHIGEEEKKDEGVDMTEDAYGHSDFKKARQQARGE
ncbi:hypothetical protein ADUPG1_007045 [Aduncisulcus paluster]|uniref:Uncharacterized protein n=1 Tax=Aduncisulcus paluster TaxID=2918883 RepID=A0ABQ5KKI0_9EUKA|nr:hypothetical protein ADUPG1_007045 [Aduncisulcus paluster]|eukprot:gnl/Carplike_NY0171/1820_a2469_751.p1 GENE.gnl/Carplike_NY0171/1820_a2469_751~~gnl/Carplike_NY0171/1820_a2469_751.p1  ORF type:complete len:353 (+),score=70.95 gnl/Carplike_NY0171/1820_a2469_751:94-1059(+)